MMCILTPAAPSTMNPCSPTPESNARISSTDEDLERDQRRSRLFQSSALFQQQSRCAHQKKYNNKSEGCLNLGLVNSSLSRSSSTRSLSVPEDDVAVDVLNIEEDDDGEESEDAIYDAIFSTNKREEPEADGVGSVAAALSLSTACCASSVDASSAASSLQKSSCETSRSSRRWGDSMEELEFDYDDENNEDEDEDGSKDDDSSSIQIRSSRGSSTWSTLNDSFSVYEPTLRSPRRKHTKKKVSFNSATTGSNNNSKWESLKNDSFSILNDDNDHDDNNDQHLTTGRRRGRRAGRRRPRVRSLLLEPPTTSRSPPSTRKSILQIRGHYSESNLFVPPLFDSDDDDDDVSHNDDEHHQQLSDNNDNNDIDEDTTATTSTDTVMESTFPSTSTSASSAAAAASPTAAVPSSLRRKVRFSTVQILEYNTKPDYRPPGVNRTCSGDDAANNFLDELLLRQPRIEHAFERGCGQYASSARRHDKSLRKSSRRRHERQRERQRLLSVRGPPLPSS